MSSKHDAAHASDYGWRRQYGAYVCENCVNDEFLRTAVVAQSEDRAKCSFCGCIAPGIRVAPLDAILTLIGDALHYYYIKADEVLNASDEDSWESAPDTSDILGELLEDAVEHGVYDALVEAFDNDKWVERSFPNLPKDQMLIGSWEDFAKQVKYQTRYLFLMSSDDDTGIDWIDDTIRADRMLATLGDIVASMDPSMIQDLGPETSIFRSRTHEFREVIDDAYGIGPDPQARQANRMSPAGISMFYGALDEVTAIAELHESARPALSTGCFRPLRPLRMLDLTRIPAYPSCFDEHRRQLQTAIAFLGAFCDSITRQVNPSDENKLEYVPSQIVTEYFRHGFHTQANIAALDGIIYRSAQNDDGRCVVLFAGQEGFVDQSAVGERDDDYPDPLCYLVDGSIKTVRRQWPTPESLADRLLSAFQEAAEAESEPERKGMLSAIAQGIGGVGREVLIRVATEVITGRVPHP